MKIEQSKKYPKHKGFIIGEYRLHPYNYGSSEGTSEILTERDWSSGATTHAAISKLVCEALLLLYSVGLFGAIT